MGGLRWPIFVDDLIVGTQFFWNVPAIVRHPLTRDEARAVLRRRLEGREASFLSHVAEFVYGNRASPYRRLLVLAGCEYGDLERLVRQDGVEGALGALLREGVYLTLEEFKGRQAVVRDTTTFTVDPRGFANPCLAVHLPTQSSGSRGVRTQVGINLLRVREEAVDAALIHEAYGDRGWRNAVWGVPGGWCIVRVLELASFGVAPARWFSQIDPWDRELPARYRVSARALRWGGLLAGLRLPRPEHVPLADPLPIVRWITTVLPAGGIPNLVAYASSAVRACQATAAAGFDIRGARFTMSGEPVTPARVAAIRQVGGYVMPRCASTETGPIGVGCLFPEASDDLHVFTDLHAAVQPGAIAPR